MCPATATVTPGSRAPAVPSRNAAYGGTGRPAPETLRPGLRKRRERIVRAARNALITSDYGRLMVAAVARG